MSYIQKLKDLVKQHKGQYNFTFSRVGEERNADKREVTNFIARVVLKGEELYWDYTSKTVDDLTLDKLIHTERQAESVYARIQNIGGYTYNWIDDERFRDITKKPKIETRWDEENHTIINVEIPYTPD